MLTDATVNSMLDNQFTAGANNMQLSLHSAFSSSGANLVGSKTNCNFAAASSRSAAALRSQPSLARPEDDSSGLWTGVTTPPEEWW